MTLELLYVPGCPHHGAALDLVRKVLSEEDLRPDFNQTPISTYDEAKRHGFPGSPTFRVNGQDIEHLASDELPVGLACRMYVVDGKTAGVPPRIWLEHALRRAQAFEDRCR